MQFPLVSSESVTRVEKYIVLHLAQFLYYKQSRLTLSSSEPIYSSQTIQVNLFRKKYHIETIQVKNIEVKLFNYKYRTIQV